MLAMMFGSLVQISLWGALFVYLGEFDDLAQAIYHSAVNYTSLGYGGVVMGAKWKLLGPLEAMNGVLMLGMSAAALMAILREVIKRQRSVRPLGQGHCFDKAMGASAFSAILDRAGLEARAYECYAVVKKESDRLLPDPPPAACALPP